jgi:hypothetical protein
MTHVFLSAEKDDRFNISNLCKILSKMFFSHNLMFSLLLSAQDIYLTFDTVQLKYAFKCLRSAI